MNLLLFKYIYFHANMYKYSIKVVQEKRQIIKQQVSYVSLKLAISNVKTGLKKNAFLLFLSAQYRIRDKTLAITFRARCIGSQKLLLSPSLPVIWWSFFFKGSAAQVGYPSFTYSKQIISDGESFLLTFLTNITLLILILPWLIYFIQLPRSRSLVLVEPVKNKLRNNCCVL